MTAHEKGIIKRAEQIFEASRESLGFHTHPSFAAFEALTAIRNDINTISLVDSFEAGDRVFSFVNLGDTYDRTVMWEDSRGFFWSSVGDIVEGVGE